MIDSGASTTVITHRAAAKAGMNIDAPGVEQAVATAGMAVERSRRSWNVTPDTCKIGARPVDNADVDVIDADEFDVDVLLGADFLRAHRVLFAMSQGKLYYPTSVAMRLADGAASNPGCDQEADAGNRPTPR